jgi:hypothetical protein
MSEHQARLERDVYDHEHDEPHGSGGRRRRPVADWGVGDDVFDHMPRRRFSRAADGPPRDRRSAAHGDGPERRSRREDVGADQREDAEAAPAPKARRRTVVIDRPDDVPSEIAALTADRDLGADAALEEPLTSTPVPEASLRTAPVSDAPPARRTVRIGGRPEGALPQARFHQGPQRRRPSRPVAERLGPRPERLAAWAFALGLLLILIAILSAH